MLAFASSLFTSGSLSFSGDLENDGFWDSFSWIFPVISLSFSRNLPGGGFSSIFPEITREY
jgi:hypothetical protein